MPHIAARFYQVVTNAINGLVAMPDAGPPKPTANRQLGGLRMWPVKGFDEFWVYYLARSDSVIVRILHSKRDIGSILEDQDVRNHSGLLPHLLPLPAQRMTFRGGAPHRIYAPIQPRSRPWRQRSKASTDPTADRKRQDTRP